MFWQLYIVSSAISLKICSLFFVQIPVFNLNITDEDAGRILHQLNNSLP